MDERLGHQERGLRRLSKNRRGETLVEVIVAFSVLMLLLAMVTTVVQGAIRLNNRAKTQLYTLAQDCVEVEDVASGSTSLSPLNSSELTLTLQYDGDASTPGDLPGTVNYDRTEDVIVFNGDILHAFFLKTP